MPEGKPIKITPAKGRPMLTWVGKRPLSQVTAFPAQHIETFDPNGDAARRAAQRDLWADWPDRYPRGGLLFHGDNKEVLAHLLANGFRGKVKLIYIDPPFDSGADYVRRVRLRGATGAAQIEGEGYTLGEQIQYEDIWANDNYLQFMYERLLLLKELLAEDGSCYVHMDERRSHYLKIVLDEVFGTTSFMNQISWKRYAPHSLSTKRFDTITDQILFYVKDPMGYQFALQYEPLDKEELRRRFPHVEPETGRRFQHVALEQASNASSRGEERLIEGRRVTTSIGWRWTQETFDKRLADNPHLIYWTEGGRPRYKVYADEYQGRPLGDMWTDIPYLSAGDAERGEYPTQKPEELLERIIRASSNPGDLVLDCFIGSGTTAAVAQKLGRRWIGCDINRGAIQTTSKRLQTIIQEQIAAQGNNGQGKLVDSEDAPPEPAQLSFTVWRVNDYDLQIQHNEAVNLACEHIGIQRTRTDPFFDGVLGRNLVKIIPFNHPLSPLDLDEIRRELEARPEEDRNITVVCLGKELAADAWIEDWNRLRKGDKAVNRIEVIELRTDPRYGKFFEHKPASAKVKITRKRGQIHVEIQDFVSPTIIERLAQQSGVLKPQIEDWRAMVDCVMIDPAYKGEVFNVALSDVPAKKDDLVSGTYTLPAPDGETTVAVKIIDMLGEEVLVTERI